MLAAGPASPLRAGAAHPRRLHRHRILAAVPGGHEPPRGDRACPAAPDGSTRRLAAVPGWTQLQLSAPGESLDFDKRHWAASAITGPALQQVRGIAAGLAAARGWNARIVIETGRALAVVLAGHQPGDMIAWSQLPAALHRRDLSITRTTEILGLAGLLHDDRIPSFTSLARARLALLPPPMAAGVRDWLRTRSQGGPRSRSRDEHTVRMNFNRVHPLLLEWAGHYVHLREVTTADVIAATGPLPPAGAGRPSPPCARCSATPRRPARSSATPPAASATASVP